MGHANGPVAAAIANEPASPRFIGRQLALGFGSVSLVAIAMCALLVWVIQDVAGSVASMRHDEASIRQGMELSAAVRGMALHIAQSLLEGDSSPPRRYELARDRVRERIQTLATRIPKSERHRLVALGNTTQHMHELLIASALPAARRGDLETVRAVHRELDHLGTDAARQADALASLTTRQMAYAHDDATSSTRLGLWGGGLCAVLIVVLSGLFTHRLRSVVLRPLQALTDAALRYGRGEFAFRVGSVGKGEYATLGAAFSHMADELATREAKLLHNERMAVLGQLAAGVAHELNNPIAIIRGYLKTMSPTEDPATLGEELAILDEEAGHCQRIADDLLSYARVEDLVLDALPIKSFLEETRERYQVSTGAAPIELVADEAIVRVDPARLRQVLLNLLHNAAQVSPPEAAVRIHGRLRAGQYQLEVLDQGPGVADVDKQRIFEPFFSNKKGGTGLGLAVCQGIINAHGGRIEVDDAPGGGALFRLVLPLDSRQAPPARSVTEPSDGDLP